MVIHELAEKTGLSVYTIRFYEKEGLLDSRHVRREANNYRDYSDEAIERLKLVKKFQGIGCSIAEMKDIFQGQDMRDYGYDPDNTKSHFNAKGCYFVGKFLADYIKKHYAIAQDQ